MQLISTFNKGIRFLLCPVDIFSKYGWIVPLKDKKCATIVNALQKILYSLMKLHLKGKPNKICVDKGSAFYNNSFKKWLKEDDIKMYSTQNERKFVAAERFIRTLKNKIQKHMTSISKNVYNDKLDDIVNEQSNAYHRTIKVKPVDVKNDTYINIGKEINDKDLKFKVGDHVGISKYKGIFAKECTPDLV